MCFDISVTDPLNLSPRNFEECFDSSVVDDVLKRGGTCGPCQVRTRAPKPSIPEECRLVVPCTRAIDGRQGVVFCYEMPESGIELNLCIEVSEIELALGFTGPGGGCGTCGASKRLEPRTRTPSTPSPTVAPGTPTTTPTPFPTFSPSNPFPPTNSRIRTTPVPTVDPESKVPKTCKKQISCNGDVNDEPGYYMCFSKESKNLYKSYCMPLTQIQRALDAGGRCGLCTGPIQLVSKLEKAAEILNAATSNSASFSLFFPELRYSNTRTHQIPEQFTKFISF